MPELRKDPVAERWVVIATERVRRPGDFPARPAAGPSAPCALCPGREHETPPALLTYEPADAAATNGTSWRVRVVPNRFPALRIEGELQRRGRGIYDLMTGVGAHEIVVESPDHDQELGKLAVENVAEVLRAYRDRVSDLKRDERFRCVTIFKNHGAAAGAAFAHPHSQLVATPVVPMIVADELHNAREYHGYKECCLFCDILHQEIDEGTRLVTEGEHMVAFAPFAARFPFETWILPRRHAAAFEHIDTPELMDLAAVLRDVLRKVSRCIGEPPYNLWLHSVPFDASDSPHYHWHIEIVPRLLRGAGLEWGSGMHLNPLPPEDAARFLRDTPA